MKKGKKGAKANVGQTKYAPSTIGKKVPLTGGGKK